MLDRADVRVEGDLAESLHRSIPFLKSKALRDKVRGYITEGRVAYPELKRLHKLLAADKRAKDLLLADFDRTLRKAVFIFPEGTTNEGNTPEDKEYRRMIGDARGPIYENFAGIRHLAPYLNLLLSMFGASAGVFLMARHFFSMSLESSVIWAVVSALLFTIVEIYQIVKTE